MKARQTQTNGEWDRTPKVVEMGGVEWGQTQSSVGAGAGLDPEWRGGMEQGQVHSGWGRLSRARPRVAGRGGRAGLEPEWPEGWSGTRPRALGRGGRVGQTQSSGGGGWNGAGSGVAGWVEWGQTQSSQGR